MCFSRDHAEALKRGGRLVKVAMCKWPVCSGPGEGAIPSLPLSPQADELVGRAAGVTTLASSVSKHKGQLLPAAVLTFTRQSDFAVTQRVHRAAAGQPLNAS